MNVHKCFQCLPLDFSIFLLSLFLSRLIFLAHFHWLPPFNKMLPPPHTPRPIINDEYINMIFTNMSTAMNRCCTCCCRPSLTCVIQKKSLSFRWWSKSKTFFLDKNRFPSDKSFVWLYIYTPLTLSIGDIGLKWNSK